MKKSQMIWRMARNCKAQPKLHIPSHFSLRRANDEPLVVSHSLKHLITIICAHSLSFSFRNKFACEVCASIAYEYRLALNTYTVHIIHIQFTIVRLANRFNRQIVYEQMVCRSLRCCCWLIFFNIFQFWSIKMHPLKDQ